MKKVDRKNKENGVDLNLLINKLTKKNISICEICKQHKISIMDIREFLEFIEIVGEDEGEPLNYILSKPITKLFCSIVVLKKLERLNKYTEEKLK